MRMTWIRRADHGRDCRYGHRRETRKVDFTQDATRSAAEGLRVRPHGQAWAPGKWVVQAEGTNKFLAQTDADRRARGFPSRCCPTSPPRMSISRCASSRCRAASIKRRVWSGDTRTRTTTTSFAPTRSKTTSCSTRSRSGRRTDLPVKGEGRTYGKKARCRPANGARCASSRAGRVSRSTSTARSCTKSRTPRLRRPGKVGVWTKADSVTQFDDLTVVTK